MYKNKLLDAIVGAAVVERASMPPNDNAAPKMKPTNDIWMFAFRNETEKLSAALSKSPPEAINRAFTRQWTPLYAAASKGNTASVRILLDYGADVDLTTEKLWTPLMAAAAAGKVAITKMLLDYGADPNARNDQGMAAIGLARSASMESCERLLEGAPTLFEAFNELRAAVYTQEAPTAATLVQALKKAADAGLGGPMVVSGMSALASTRRVNSTEVNAAQVESSSHTRLVLLS